MSKSGAVRTGSHTSRDQSSREATVVHETDHIDFETSGPLPEIEARPGYVQRWIRVKKGKEDDARNLYNATRKGWAPRAASTVSKSLQWLTVQREGLGGVIGTHDLVLMERHEDIHKNASKHNKEVRRSLEKAVKNNLFSEHKNLGGSGSGFSAPEIENRASVERGKRVSVDDD